MRYTILLAFLFFACNRNDEPDFRFTARSLPMYEQFKEQLDLSAVQTIRTRENVVIFLTPFKDNSKRIYAASRYGEVLYANKMRDKSNGPIGILKEGAAVRIDFVNGAYSIGGMEEKEYRLFFAQNKHHGGTGFCQLEKGESFSDCFKKETDEFCDSFISCVALATQPTVSIVIALACSCDAKIEKVESKDTTGIFHNGIYLSDEILNKLGL